MNDDIINLESRLVFRDVSKLTAGGMSTAAALAHAAHEAAERKAKMTTGFAQDDYIRSLEEQIATLQSELAAASAELARAREALIKQWELVFTRSYSQNPIGRAEDLYAREIEKVCTYPKCNCMFDMGVDNKCWQGYPMPVIAHKGEEG